MDEVAMATAILGATQQLALQNVKMAVIKSAANAQNQIANMIAASSDQPLLTSGSIGTNINTTA